MRLRSFFVLGLSLFLIACTTTKQQFQVLKDRPNAYMKSQAFPPLTVPPGIDHAPLMQDHPVPPGEVPSDKVPLLPPESLAEKVAQGKVSKKELKRLSSSNLEERDNQWFLMLTDDRDHVWDKLEKAFKNRLIRVLQKDKATYTYYIVDTYMTKGKITLKSPIYQVHLRVTAEQNTEIYLTDNKGEIPNKYAARRLLVEINKGLSGDKLRELPGVLKKWMSDKS